VAHLAGVSQATVSLVLNDVPGARISRASRRRVIEAANSLDYHPNATARSLVRQRAGVVGLVMRQSPNFLGANAVLPSVIRGFTSVAGPAGFKTLVEPIEDVSAPDVYMRLAREAHVDGIVISGARSDDEQLLRLDSSDFPIVLWGHLAGSDLPFVDVDNVAAAKIAVDHLIGLGHRHIACITNGPLQDSASASRLRGYRQALESHGLDFDPALVRYGDFEESSGHTAMLSLLALSEPPSAVFVASDETALGALRAARSRGVKVPEELAVVGFDNLPISEYVSPALTTVNVPTLEIGAVAARMLLQIIETEKRPESVFLETRLVIRETCGSADRSARRSESLVRRSGRPMA
jgi:LacI family transcriptional regulator